MMLYTSTRNKAVHVSSAQAIAQGISAEGGLFVPEEIPKLSMELTDRDLIPDEILRLIVNAFVIEKCGVEIVKQEVWNAD